MVDFTKYKYYYNFDEPIEFNDFTAIGYFPYECAGIYNNVKIPRDIYSKIENLIPVKDNKMVVIFQDNVNFGTENFAIFFKDYYASVGYWEDVTGYGGRKLELK